jgi:uncharacterized secreted protein with C-terminal beta-propeller domain
MQMKRFVLLVAILFASLGVLAASVEDRSPFRQGHWWDPSKSGHGFEILNAADQVFLVWYTYNDAGAPIWYTAQGSRESLGGVWILQKHTWGNGRIARSENVGTMRLAVNHFEKMTASWQLGSTQGTWSLEPFVQSGTQNEVDLTGHWYDPAHSGWGLTLVDQGDVFGAVIYAYDPSGAPTWVAGFDRGKGTKVALYRTRGSCPSCEYRIVGTEPAGSIEISYRGDTSVTVRGTPAIALANDLQVDGVSLAQVGRPASTRRVDFQLAAFRSGATLKAFLDSGMENRTFGGYTDFSPAPPSASTAFSTTNLQESGVDEADAVKSDGRYVYAVTPLRSDPAKGEVFRNVRIAYVGDNGSTLEPRGELRIAGDAKTASSASLYVQAGKLATVSTGYNYGMMYWSSSPSPGATTTIEILDLATPESPKSLWRGQITGQLVSSRRIGDRLYAVLRSTPDVPGYFTGAYSDAQRASNRAALEATPLEKMLPSIAENGAPARPMVGPESVYLPAMAGRKPVADLTLIAVIDLAQPRLVQSLAVVGRTETLYASASNLYVSSTRYDIGTPFLTASVAQPALYSTDIHQIGIGASGISVVASGSVEGTVGSGEMAPFRFGEYAGGLRVVTSTGSGMWGIGNVNRLTILEPSTIAPGLLKTVSWLPNAGRPEPIGKPNEFLHSTRFVGERLYAVTFKKIDPLYVIDLSNRSDPRIVGTLEIPGFSDYLHPLDNGLVLGFGKDTKPSDTSADGGQFAWYQGLHLTLFDVSNPSQPRQVQRVLMGKRGSDSPLLYTHHAFSALARPDGSLQVAIPAQINDGPTQPVDWATAPWDYSGLLRFEIRGSTAADARIVQMPTLVSDRAGGPGSYPAYDSDNASRSVLFPDASVFVSGGRFFRIEASGAQYGPY